MQNTISLKLFDYNKDKKQLSISSGHFKSFPHVLTIKSHVTGKIVDCKPIGPEHPMFDEDQWDGEQMIYEPIPICANTCPNIKTVVIYNS